MDDGKRFGMMRLFNRLKDNGTIYFPTGWTDRAPKDPFVELAQGRALARPSDLLDLAKLVAAQTEQGVRENKPEV